MKLTKIIPLFVFSVFASIVVVPVVTLAQPFVSVELVTEKPAFTLTSSGEIAAVGTVAIGFEAISTGGLILSFSLSPAAPAGMSFDTSTGALSGSPSVPKSAKIFTVTATNASGKATQRFTLAVNPAIPEFVLSESSATVVIGEAIGFTTISTGGSISRFSISPDVPRGMVFASRSGSLFGFPRFEQVATTYTVTGVGLGGSVFQQFVLTVNAKAPVFRLSRYIQTVASGSAAGFTVKSTGGPISTFSISPDVPAGMSFDASTGALSGQPTDAQLATPYTVTATNVSGEASQQFVLTVTASLPVFTLSSSNQIVGQGSAAGFTVVSTGGAATFTISARPAGMSFDALTGELSGNPSVVKSTTTFLVTATNASGKSTQRFTLTVNPAIPEFVLSEPSATVAVGEEAGFAASSTGGSISKFSISPNAPSGMVFSSQSGSLFGFPRFEQLATTYTVTGVGLGGSSSQQFVLTVNAKAPVFRLSRYIQTVVKGSAAGFSVSSTGGAISRFSISPAAPAGMSFNTSTGVLSGSPTGAQLATSYTVTATNVSGSPTQSFELTVTTPFPVFTLLSSSQTVAQGDSAGFTVSSTGGPISTFSISPAAPVGMSFDTFTGALSGSPSVVRATTTYSVTASNVSGKATQQFMLTVNPATPEFALSRSFHNAAVGLASGFTVISTGGFITRYAISPRTPEGMLFSSITGSLSGKPKALQLATVYTVTATNASGSASQEFQLSVTRTGSDPSFVLSVSSQSVNQGSAAGFTVSSTGGAISRFSISPDAPAGMSFNTSTGALSGSPSVEKVATTYTVTGSNSFASVERTYVLTVKLVAPAFTLTLSSQSVYQGDAAGFTVNSTGGAATYSIDPLAPAGMSLNTSTGALSGNPSTIKSITTYTVTARNALGSASQEFLLTVNVKVPVFTLSLSIQTVAQGSAAGFTVSSTGGAATYSIDPLAPAGMSFNTSTGQLSGNPSTIKSATIYTVTADNASGRPTRTFELTVNLKAPVFTLSLSIQTVVQGSAAGFTVSSTGGAATYSIDPLAPAGMSFNTSTGQLSGSPTNAQALTTYTVKATNISGEPTQTYKLTVSAKSCAAGGTCRLGEPGPGGGTVVFVDEGGFACLANLASICRYMEAVDPSLQLKWSGNTTTSVGGTSDAIGAGYKNNDLAIIQSGTLNTAIRKAWDFSQNEKSDWNLPSANELQQVWNEFTPKNSWTSTQHANANMAKMGKSTGGFQGFPKTGTPWIFYVRCFG